jgi:hypothetical protein
MARITYDPLKIGSVMVAEAVDHIAKAQALLARAKSLADSISAGGAQAANLEGCAEFGVAASQGSAFYSAVAAMKTNAATVTAAAIADVDQGG